MHTSSTRKRAPQLKSTASLRKVHMAHPQTKKPPANFATTEQGQVETPVSSGDTVQMEFDMAAPDGPVDEGYHTNHESKKTGTAEGPMVGASSDGSRSVTPANTDGGLHRLGRGVKSLVQAIQTLRDLGVEILGLPLPKIVVVGDQSTGKSSLIEGISEIKVPRHAGTCTRCPLEINLVENSEADSQWSCKITLITKYYHDSELLERATKARPLGPWVAQDRADKFHLATLTSKSQVEDALYRAQLAILNIGNSNELYKLGSSLPKDNMKVKFSPNVIQLDISGPDLPNLSFYDLPGVINVSEVAHEEYLVPLVRNLVTEYISTKDCINLLAIPMTDDPANSSASRLIRDIKGACERTIGVITKPDRFQKGESFEQWDQILKGERYELGFGYFVVRNSPDTRVSNSLARREEDAYFSEEEPWSTTLSKYEDHFGTTKLVTSLSQKLTEQIRTSLPHIREQVERKAILIKEKLRGLPEPLEGNLPARLYGELLKFEFELVKHFDGGFNDCPFQKDWHNASLEFRKIMEGMYPLVTVTANPTPSRKVRSSTFLGDVLGTPTPTKNRTPISIDSDTDNEEPPKLSPASRKHIAQKRSHPSAQSTPQKIARMSEGPRSTADKIGRKRFELDEIREILQDHYIGLPGETDPKATEKMIKLSMAHWEDPVSQFVSRAGGLCQNMIYERVLDVFGHRQNTKFYSELTDICGSFLTKATDDQLKTAKQILSWELLKPTTLNEVALGVAKVKAIEYLQKKRRDCLAKVWLDQEEESTGKQTTGPIRLEKMAKVTDTQLGPDPYSLEIKAMGSVRAYYDLAFSRFVDVVCTSTYGELFMKCRNDLVTAMKEHFRVTDPDADQRLTVLLAANPYDELRRAQLKREMETISKAQEHLEGLSGDE